MPSFVRPSPWPGDKTITVSRWRNDCLHVGSATKPQQRKGVFELGRRQQRTCAHIQHVCVCARAHSQLTRKRSVFLPSTLRVVRSPNRTVTPSCFKVCLPVKDRAIPKHYGIPPKQGQTLAHNIREKLAHTGEPEGSILYVMCFSLRVCASAFSRGQARK